MEEVARCIKSSPNGKRDYATMSGSITEQQKPNLQIEWFCLHAWFSKLKDLKQSLECQLANEFQAIPVENGFYYLLSNYTDQSVLREAVYYTLYLHKSKVYTFKKLRELITKIVPLLLYHYMNIADTLHIDVKEKFNVMEFEEFSERLQKVQLELQSVQTFSLKELESVLFADPLELPWRLALATRTCGELMSQIRENTFAIFSVIILSIENKQLYKDPTYRIQRLETIGADFAFYSRILTVEMADMFLAPVQQWELKGWRTNYCVNILSRLIFPILNLKQKDLIYINMEALRKMFLSFITYYTKPITVTMYDTQLVKARQYFAQNECDNLEFETALKTLNWSGQSVDTYPWTNCKSQKSQM